MRGQRGEPSYLSVSDTLGGRSSSLFSKYKVGVEGAYASRRNCSFGV